MRLAQVIGRVMATLRDPGLGAGRLLLLSPLDLTQLRRVAAGRCAGAPSAEPTVVAWDELGAGDGQLVGFVEGAEATAPFDRPIPLDALVIALIDTLDFVPAD